MRETARLARRHGVRLHTHLAETADEDEYCLATYGVRPVELMERCEFIGPDVFYAHGIFFNDEELASLRARGRPGRPLPLLQHAPRARASAGCATCWTSGIPVSLAVDGSASNDSSDFLGEMRHALLLQRVARGSGALDAREVLKMATETGAAVLGFEGIGRIREGYAADLAVFDVDRMEYCGSLSDPFAALHLRRLRPRHRVHDLQREGRRGQGQAHRHRRRDPDTGRQQDRRAPGTVRKSTEYRDAYRPTQSAGAP